MARRSSWEGVITKENEAPEAGSGSGREIRHDEVIVTNSDISAARVVQVNGPSHYAIRVDFNAAGAARMRAAPEKHVGSLVAFLFDGQVVMTPVLRSPISTSAEITGTFTRTQAERMAERIEIR